MPDGPDPKTGCGYNGELRTNFWSAGKLPINLRLKKVPIPMWRWMGVGVSMHPCPCLGSVQLWSHF